MIRRHRKHAGFSFIELLLALSISVILMGGMASAIMIANRAVDDGQGAGSAVAETAVIVDEMAANIRLAIRFTERTATAMTFTVPDRDGDGTPETIRYAWSGTPGDPLTLEYADSDPVVLAPSVENLDLSYLVTTLTGSGGTSESGDTEAMKVLFVVKRADNLLSDELLRKFLMESWGYEVTLIEHEDSQAAFDAAVALNDVAYISDQIDDNKLETRLTAAPIGVVNENRGMTDRLDLADGTFQSQNGASVIIEDNEHYITKPFFPGLLPVLSDVDPLIYSEDPLAAGAITLASEPGEPTRRMLLTIEEGDPLYSGTPAPARRVVMPWGQNIDFSELSDQGRQLLQRAFQWAAEAEIAEVLDSPLFSQLQNPAAGGHDHTIKADKWAVASIVPDLPVDAISWKVTRFRFLAQQKGDPTATLVLQIRGRAADGKPTTDVLAQTFIAESDLPVLYDWVEVEFTMFDSIPATEGACVCIGMLAGSDGGEVYYESGEGTATPADQFVDGKPGDWDDPSEDEDIPCEVFGTTETSILP